MRDRRDLKIAIIGHPIKKASSPLARRRAEAIKWHLVDLGIAQDRITTKVGAVSKAQPIEIVVTPSSPATH